MIFDLEGVGAFFIWTKSYMSTIIQLKDISKYKACKKVDSYSFIEIKFYGVGHQVL